MLARFLALIVVALLCASPALACPQKNCVRIGSWNIAWLGSDKRTQASDPATIERMATLLADEWSIDIISLEEINTEMDGNYRGDHLNTASWMQLRKALEKRGYRTQSGESGNAQRVVLAWRAPVVVIEKPADLPIPDSYRIDEYCRSANLRKPLAGMFQAGKFDFWAIGLHLKSSYGNNAACANAVRSQQAYYLGKQLDSLRKKDRDIILVGDFNASSKHDSLAALREKGFVSVTDKDYRHSQSGSRSHGSGKRGTVIDLVMLHPSDTREWVGQSTVLYEPSDIGVFTRQFSDHFPVWADFSTLHDDDT